MEAAAEHGLVKVASDCLLVLVCIHVIYIH